MRNIKKILEIGWVMMGKKREERRELFEMVKEIFFRRVYNPKGFEIGADDVVVDIGANVGVFTIFAAGKTKNKIIAYEPFLKNFEALKLNTKDLRQVKCFCEGVSRKAGKQKLYLDGDYTVGILFDRNIHGKLKKNVWVRTTTLKDIFIKNKLKRIDFLKIDAEGSEGDILKSCLPAGRSTPLNYLKKIKKISLEFHDNVSCLKHEEIIRLLKKAGFITKLHWQKGSFFGYIYGKRE